METGDAHTTNVDRGLTPVSSPVSDSAADVDVAVVERPAAISRGDISPLLGDVAPLLVDAKLICIAGTPAKDVGVGGLLGLNRRPLVAFADTLIKLFPDRVRSLLKSICRDDDLGLLLAIPSTFVLALAPANRWESTERDALRLSEEL